MNTYKFVFATVNGGYDIEYVEAKDKQKAMVKLLEKVDFSKLNVLTMTIFEYKE